MSSLEQCVSHLRQLIASPTVNPGGDELSLCRSLGRQLDDLGADRIEVEATGKGAYVYAGFGHPELLLNVHLDTVPANNGWTQDPFTATVTEDRVIGLGACDIKGAIAAILCALEASTPRRLGVLFSGDEEAGSSVMREILDSPLGDTLKSECRAAIVCEPTSRCAVLKHRGAHRYLATYQGKGGHSSKADHMEKPIVELARLALELDELGLRYLDRGPDDMKGLCMNVASLEGGVAYNVVPDSAELSFSLRPPPEFEQEAFDGDLEAARLAAHDKIELQVLSQHHPFACSDEERIRSILEDWPRAYVGVDFWTEAALLEEAGIPAVVCGPGDIAQAHTADEFVLLEDLDWAVQMFTDVIKNHGS